MRQVEVAVIGTGWCGGIRAETLARSALVDSWGAFTPDTLPLATIAAERPAALKIMETIDFEG